MGFTKDLTDSHKQLLSVNLYSFGEWLTGSHCDPQTGLPHNETWKQCLVKL